MSAGGAKVVIFGKSMTFLLQNDFLEQEVTFLLKSGKNSKMTENLFIPAPLARMSINLVVY